MPGPSWVLSGSLCWLSLRCRFGVKSFPSAGFCPWKWLLLTCNATWNR